jgi:hypothetical protein
MSVFVLPNRDNIKKWTCPNCGRVLDAYRIDKHLPACPKQPAMLERLAEVLPDPDNPEVIIAYNRYKTLRINDPELPSWTIILSTWGEWSAVAKEFGLVTVEEFEQRKGDGSLLPATIAELRRLSNELYEGVVGPSYSDYMELSDKATGAQRCKVLVNKFGAWEDVLAAVDLKHETWEYYWHARKMRRDAAKAAAVDPEAALDAPLGSGETLSAFPLPKRPVPVIMAQPTPDKLGMIYKLPKLPDDIAPRVYGHVVSQVIETARETRYTFR